MWDRWWEWALRPRMMVLMTVLLLERVRSFDEQRFFANV